MSEITFTRIGNPYKLLDHDVNREIDDDAAKKHSAASFLIKQVGQIDEDARREAFQIPDTVRGVEEARLSYEGTLEVIDSLVARETRPVGVDIYFSMPGYRPSSPAATIGFAEFSPPLPEGDPTEHQTHELNISEKGLRIINRYLGLLGQPTVQEQSDQEQAEWISALEAD